MQWHRAIFKFHWSWISRKRKRVGRKPTNKDLRDLIFRMVAENRTWGAPRIHGELKQINFRSPWQNGIAERFVGNCRRDLLDHVIVLNKRHAKRLMIEYILYYHEDRTRLGLEKQTPGSRAPTLGPNGYRGQVIAMSRLAGLHHR